MRLKDKVALITGGARGIGRATAELVLKEGARVAVVDVDADEVSQVAAELGESAMGLAMDVTSQESVKAGVEAILARFGQIDILVNNAGIIRDASLAKMQEADFDAVVSVNLKGVYNVGQTVAQHMVARGSVREFWSNQLRGHQGRGDRHDQDLGSRTGPQGCAG
jgi:3-oxoacyl-[acyl-carrier protein] reductase